MPTALVVTQNPETKTAIERALQKAGVRARTASIVKTAREWLSTQMFDAVLVDLEFPNSVPIEVITMGWQKNPMMLGGLFSLRQENTGQWDARLLGAQIFSGPKALDDLRRVLENLPNFGKKDTTFPILVVEDLDAPRDIICTYIESLGYGRVHAASSGKEALALLREKPTYYMTVISDLNMPEMNGIELIESVRADSDIRHIPVLILTANATSDNLVQCVRAGATGFIAKPPKKKILQQEINKAKRLVLTGYTPRLCQPEEAALLKDALRKYES